MPVALASRVCVSPFSLRSAERFFANSSDDSFLIKQPLLTACGGNVSSIMNHNKYPRLRQEYFENIVINNNISEHRSDQIGLQESSSYDTINISDLKWNGC
jgi:hypothetical protein